MQERSSILRRFQDGDDRLLAAHILDKIEWTARRNALSATMFLNSHECTIAEQVISSAGFPAHIITGGIPEAERKAVLFLSDYLSEEDIAPEDLPFCAVRAKWGKENSLSHRDVLGSLMSLGIRREILGDILAGETSCDIIVLRECMPFLLSNWESIGRVGIHPEEVPLSELSIPQTDGEELHDTVATLRLDAVLGSGFSLSRSRAAELVKSGKVLRNGKECTKPDAALQEGDCLSVRSFGRLVLRKVGELSKKGRIRITIEKFG